LIENRWDTKADCGWDSYNAVSPPTDTIDGPCVPYTLLALLDWLQNGCLTLNKEGQWDQKYEHMCSSTTIEFFLFLGGRVKALVLKTLNDDKGRPNHRLTLRKFREWLYRGAKEPPPQYKLVNDEEQKVERWLSLLQFASDVRTQCSIMAAFIDAAGFDS
jgi:hypothetical protein